RDIFHRHGRRPAAARDAWPHVLGAAAAKTTERTAAEHMKNGMKSYHGSSGGGITSVVLKEHQKPEPGPGEVLVRVHANSLNAPARSVPRGTYPLPVKPDVVMCADGAGSIEAVGASVTRVQVGDRVAAAMFPRWIDGPIAWEYAPQIGGSLDGMLTEYIALDE